MSRPRIGSDPASAPSPSATALFLLAAALTGLFLVWLGIHGLPRFTTDAICFKQAADMFNNTGVFARPTYGKIPHTMVVMGEYPPAYVYANVFTFKALGYTYGASHALDLGIHFLLALVVGYTLFRVTRSAIPAAAYMLLTPALLHPMGRPEEFGALMLVGALIAGSRDDWRFALSAPLLALCMASTPIQAIVGILLFVTANAIRVGVNRRFFLRMIAAGSGAGAIALAIYLWTIWPHFTEAQEQFWHAANHPERWAPSMSELWTRRSTWAVSFFSYALVLIVAGVWKLAGRRGPERLAGAEASILAALIVSLPFCIGIHMYFDRPQYDYRMLGHLYLAGALYGSYSLAVSQAGIASVWLRRGAGIAMFAWVIAMAVYSNVNMVRYALAPLSWGEGSMTYPDAVDRVAELVPRDATVGGDPALFMLTETGRPYYALHWLGDGWNDYTDWPEYLLSGTFLGGGGKAYLLNRGYGERMEAEYEEIPVPLPPKGCRIEVPLLGTRIKIANSSCDWNVRVWKRKAGPGPLG